MVQFSTIRCEDVRNPHTFDEGRRGGRGRGLIHLYILHSLKYEPKSGYDLLKEISEKTGGAWVPSKGTLYPMLKKMEEEGLIAVSETGKRYKNIFKLTEKGEKTLEAIVRTRREEKQKMYLYRNLLFEIFGNEPESVRAELMEIRFITERLSGEKQAEARSLIKTCLETIKGLDVDEGGNR